MRQLIYFIAKAANQFSQPTPQALLGDTKHAFGKQGGFVGKVVVGLLRVDAYCMCIPCRLTPPTLIFVYLKKLRNQRIRCDYT